MQVVWSTGVLPGGARRLTWLQVVLSASAVTKPKLVHVTDLPSQALRSRRAAGSPG